MTRTLGVPQENNGDQKYINHRQQNPEFHIPKTTLRTCCDADMSSRIGNRSWTLEGSETIFGTYDQLSINAGPMRAAFSHEPVESVTN